MQAILPFFNLLAAGDNPLDHVVDQPVVHGKPIHFMGMDLPVWLVSNVTIMLVLCGLVAIVTLVLAASRIRAGSMRSIKDFKSQGIWANLVETVCVYLRNDVFRPVLGKDTDRFTPILWTLFWFILFCNIFGLVPLKDLTALFGLNHGHGFGGTATQSVFVTGALALIAFFLINIPPLLRDPAGYFKHLTGGAPMYIWPILVPVEILGIFVKPFALCMRLFANMTGGHVVVAVMLMFIKMMVDNLGGLGYAMSLMPFVAMIGIYFLEIIVAVIQAFVFTFLTCLFLGQLIHHEHEVGHEDEHPDDMTILPGSGETSFRPPHKPGPRTHGAPAH
jgi:F-type H+-transporting ATPase subunit a